MPKGHVDTLSFQKSPTMNFASVLSALGLAPKTLPQATAALEQAKGTFDSVNALFTAAGLNLDTMLAAGPDSLKAHIAGVSAKDGELAAAQGAIKDLEGKLQLAISVGSEHKARADSTVSVLTAIGFVPVATSKPEDFTAALDAHVKKAAALELAKAGHPPVKVPIDGAKVPAEGAARADHYAHMATLPEKEQHAYFQKHLARKF